VGVSYINPRSGANWPADRALWRAPDDGGPLALAPGRGLARDDIERSETSLWRYRAAIRVDAARRVSLGEGLTPLVETAWAGRRVLFKCEHLMPTGSFKDRGSLNKWYVDEAYDKAFVNPTFLLADRMWKKVDVAIIDNAVNGVARGFAWWGWMARLIQTGETQNYALSMAMGAVMILTAYLMF